MLLAILLALLAVSTPANALSMEQAVAQCREQFSPVVRECVRRKVMGSGGSPESYIPSCKAAVMGQARACVAKLIGAAGYKQQSPADVATTPLREPGQAAALANRAANKPPRSIVDVTAILDQEKPNPSQLKKLTDAADAPSPLNSDPLSLAHFFHARAVARAQLGRFRGAIDDGERSLQLAAGRVDQLILSDFRTTVALQYMAVGEPKKTLALYLKTASDGERGEKGFLFNTYKQIAVIDLLLGDFAGAQTYAQKLQALWASASSIRGYDSHAKTWQSNVEETKARLFEARGQLDDALAAYQRAESLRRAGIQSSSTAFIPIPRSQLELAADIMLLSTARIKARQGRLADAEIDARRALLNRLQAGGKYNPQTANFIAALGALLVEQGRYQDAKSLLKATIETYRQLGVAEDSQTFIAALSNLAVVQGLEGSWAEAAESYATVERATLNWEVGRRERVLLSHGYAETLYRTGKPQASLAAASRFLEILAQRLDDQHPDTQLAHGHYAVALFRAGREPEALAEFQNAVPYLSTTAFNTDNDDVLNAAARTRYIQIVIENYIAMLGNGRVRTTSDPIPETFRLVETIRGRAVQKALTASGARISANDPALAETVRQEQDLRQQIGVQLGELNDILSLPAAERDEAGVGQMRRQIDKMRADHAKARADLDRRFPAYADLIDPKPPSIDQIRTTLRPGEAMLSFYFGQDASFVWAVPKDGTAAFSTLSITAGELATKVARLRQALDPQIEMVSDIPPFELSLAYELYTALLRPVESGWKNAKNLIVIANGALGELPLSLLPTAQSQIESKTKPLFTGYRDVPWLARSYAITVVPSASALLTLRHLPAASPNRDKLIGFGDPYFNANQAAEAAAEMTAGSAQIADAEQTAVLTRGIPLRRRAVPRTTEVDTAELSMLPRLPDTRQELIAIAKALNADPAKALFLGKDANEQNVETMNLANFQVVAFSTHGLIPGDLNGLTQPALALTAPDIADVKGDGLLTMEKILALKLDADWVVLSACNTAAGAGVGAEAASGLGRAFFYAGTRAVLVTNWSVHSASARQLVSGIFRRQVADPTLSRAEALRQASMDLADGKGFTNEAGETIFSYAHPLFWAPYTIIGDGG